MYSQVLRECIGEAAYFNTGNSNISFIEICCYLVCIIDKELTTVPQYNAVYRRVDQKWLMLCKLRYLLDTQSIVLVYKQEILPYIDYVRFALLSCNVGN